MKIKRHGAAISMVGAAVLVLAACGGQNQGGGDGSGVSGQVLIDGSSTVEPLSSAAAELFQQQNSAVNVTVATSGTGGGFEVFCRGETDISDASRPIDQEEMQACESSGIQYEELVVANDALTVVTSAENEFLQCLTVEQLRTIWSPESEGQITTWNQVDPSFPNEPIGLFGPGTDSGTFDYFTEAINGEEGASRADYQASEDDNVLVQGVTGNPNSLGYFGFTYYEENADSLKAVEIDNGQGCVAPSSETVQDGTYAPLSRPLYIYVNRASYQDKPQVAAFVDYYVQNIGRIAEAAQYIPLNEEQQGELESVRSSLGA